MTLPILRTINLTKRIGTKELVTNLNLEVQAGQIFGFLGRNGAGKTTTIRMLVALIRPTNGSVEIDGVNVQSTPELVLREIGAIVEQPSLYEYMSGYENLAFCARLRGIATKQIEEALDLVGLTSRAADRVRTYSLGMRQRLAIAAAVLHHPRLLILDEPTNGLDPQGIVDMRLLIQRLHRQGITVFLSSHLLHEVEQICTHMAIIDHGQILVQGDVQGIVTRIGQSVQRVEVVVDNADRAEALIRSLPFVSGVERKGHVFVVECDQNQIAALNRSLVTGQIDVTALIPQQVSLEECFMRLTQF